MNSADRVRLEHMLEVAREALIFAEGRTVEDLFSDRMLARSLERQVEIIGEAGSKVSEDLRRNTPRIPWADIVGMRNRLVHAYFDVNVRIVWSTVTEDLPPLMAALEELLTAESND